MKIKTTILREKESFCKLILDPIKKDWGVTLGNSIRRTILSQVKVHKICKAEFKIDGLGKEDLPVEPFLQESLFEISENLKKINLIDNILLNENKIIVIKQKFQGPCQIYVKDINFSSLSPVVKDIYICTINSKDSIKLKLTIKDKNLNVLQNFNYEKNTIDFGSNTTSPVKTVNYKVIKSESDAKLESVILEICTDKSKSAMDVFRESIILLKENLNSIELN